MGKDNPVPLIGKVKELVEEEFEELKIDIKSENEDDYHYGFNKACKMFKNSLLAKLNTLQNGVETDNEQPKQKPCQNCSNNAKLGSWFGLCDECIKIIHGV